MANELFKKNPKTEQAINKLYDNLKNSEYDTRYTWQQLADMTGLQLKTTGKDNDMEVLYYICSKVNEMLMHYNSRYMNTVHKFGKRIIKPNEHSTVARKKVQSSVKIYRKAGAIIAATNMEGMTEIQRLRLEQDANRWKTLELFQVALVKENQIENKTTTTVSANDKKVLDLIKLLKS